MSYASADLTVVARPEATRGRAIGPVFFLIFAELVVYLIALNGSTLIPGNWSAFAPLMFVYLTINALSIGVFAQNLSVPLILEGSTGRFLKVFVLFAGIGWIASLLFLSRTVGGIPAPVGGTIAFQELLFIGLFVGPAEELLFRVVLPPLVGKRYWSQLVLSSVAFAVFHIGVYTAAGVVWSPGALVFQLGWVAFLGGVFYAIDWKKVDPRNGAMTPRWGYPAGTGVHVAYDLSVLGVITGFAAAAGSLGLVSM